MCVEERVTYRCEHIESHFRICRKESKPRSFSQRWMTICLGRGRQQRCQTIQKHKWKSTRDCVQCRSMGWHARRKEKEAVDSHHWPGRPPGCRDAVVAPPFKSALTRLTDIHHGFMPGLQTDSDLSCSRPTRRARARTTIFQEAPDIAEGSPYDGLQIGMEGFRMAKLASPSLSSPRSLITPQMKPPSGLNPHTDTDGQPQPQRSPSVDINGVSIMSNDSK
jgi:hypothetical protein